MLDEIKALFALKQWDKYMDYYSQTYNFPGGSRESYRQILDNMSAAGCEVVLAKTEIVVNGDKASAYPIRMEFPRGDPMLVRLAFQKESSGWKIVGGYQDPTDADELPDVIDSTPGRTNTTPGSQF
jgi:hypothetical protein